MASTKILIIDDEQGVIDLLSLHLRKAGYALATATDGACDCKLKILAILSGNTDHAGEVDLPSHLPRRRQPRRPMEQTGQRDGGRVALYRRASRFQLL
jgi:CheY-like chemotaxis protein